MNYEQILKELNKPKHDLIRIIDALAKVSPKKAGKLNKIIARLEALQQA